MLFSPRVLSSLCFALCAVMLLAGCPGKAPISASNSGLRPAHEEEPSGDGETSGGEVDGSHATDSDEPDADGESDGSTSPDVIEKPPTRPEPTEEPANDEIFEVPDGDSTELVKYLEDVNGELRRMLQNAQRSPPSLETRDQSMARFTRLIQSQLTASKKILDDADAEAEQRNIAARTVFDAFGPLEQVGEKEAAKQARDIAVSLADDDDPQIRRMAAGVLMDEEIGKIRAGEVKDATTLLKQMEVVFAGKPDEVSMARFMSGQSAAQEMLRSEKHPQAVEIMQLMGKHFIDAEHPQLAQAGGDLLDQAKIIQLDSGVRKLEAGVDGAEAELLATAETLLTSEETDSRTMQFVSMMSASLEEKHPETRAKLTDLVNEAIQKRLDSPEVSADELATLAEVAQDLGEKYQETATAASDALMANFNEQLAAEELEAQTIGELYSNVTMPAEYSGNIELAKQTCDALVAALEKVKDEDQRESIKMQLEAAQKRVNLVGKPLVVEGALLDGKPFDWAPYKGKVVLIDFWATWCRPCLEEIPNILDNYEKYHDQGFEVVAVNIDDDPADVVEFFARQGDLPWKTVVSNNPDAAGPESAMATKCGVMSIPFVILVGRDGNVEALHVRGPELGERLAANFGDAESPAESETPAEVEAETPAEKTNPANGDTASDESEDEPAPE